MLETTPLHNKQEVSIARKATAQKLEEAMASSAFPRYAALALIAVAFVYMYIENHKSSFTFSTTPTLLYKVDQCQEDEFKLIRTACCSSQDMAVLGGVDVVEMFTFPDDEQVPTLGSPSIAAILPTRVGNFRFLFVNEENRAKFLVNPWQYAPAWGGFCAMGIGYESQYFTTQARDRLGPNSDLSTWTIINGRLYFFGGQGPKDKFLDALPDSISYGDAHWSNMFGGVYDGHFNTNCFHRQLFFDTVRRIRTPSDDDEEPEVRPSKTQAAPVSADGTASVSEPSDSNIMMGHKIVKDDEGNIIEVDGQPVAKVGKVVSPVDNSLFAKYASEKALWQNVAPTPKEDPKETFMNSHEIVRDENGMIIMIDGISIISNQFSVAASEKTAASVEVQNEGRRLLSEQVETSIDKTVDSLVSLKSTPVKIGKKQLMKLDAAESITTSEEELPSSTEEKNSTENEVSVEDGSEVENAVESLVSLKASSPAKIGKKQLLKMDVIETTDTGPAPMAEEEGPSDSSEQSLSKEVSAQSTDFQQNTVDTLVSLKASAASTMIMMDEETKAAGHKVVYCSKTKPCGEISKNLYKDDLKQIENVFNRDSIKSDSPGSENTKENVFVPTFPLLHLDKAPEDSPAFSTNEILNDDIDMLKEIIGVDDIDVVDT